LDSIPLTAIKTKAAAQMFQKLGINKALVVVEAPTESIVKSIRNLKDVKIVVAQNLGLFDLVKYPKVVFTSKAFEAVSQKCSAN